MGHHFHSVFLKNAFSKLIYKYLTRFPIRIVTIIAISELNYKNTGKLACKAGGVLFYYPAFLSYF